MKIITDETQYDGARSVLALGMFDGVHLGHRALINRAVEIARTESADAIVCTFDRNPLALLAPERCPKSLMNVTERLEKFAALGADWALVKPFTRELSEMPAEEYIRRITEATRCIAVVSGENYTFGRFARGNAAMLRRFSRELGFRAEIVGSVTDMGETVSSTLIRKLIDNGESERAARLLGEKCTKET